MGKVKVAGNPVKLSTIAPEDELPKDPAPQLGDYTYRVLTEMLGYTHEEASNYVEKYH
jgi:CoA:oxalate CoA-transferase